MPRMLLRVLARLRLVRGELHAAGLAAPADQHLRLDDDRVADLVGRADGLLDGRDGSPGRHLQAVTGEQLLALVLQQVHLRRGTLTESATARSGPQRAPMGPRRHNAGAMPHPQEHHVRHFRRYGTLIDWETGIYEAFAKEAAARRLRDRPRRADPAVPRDLARDRGRLLRALRRGAAGAPRSRSPNASSGRSSPRARASCPTRCSAGSRSRRPTPSCRSSPRSTSWAAVEHRRQAARADAPPHPDRLRPGRHRPAGALLQARTRRTSSSAPGAWAESAAGCTSRPATTTTSSRASNSACP